MLQDSQISSGDDTKTNRLNKYKKKIEIRIFPLLPVSKSFTDISGKRRLRGSSKEDKRNQIMLPKLNKRYTNGINLNKRPYDSDQASEITDIESNIDQRTIDDESMYSFARYHDSANSQNLTINTRMKKHIRATYNTEHEFLDRELFEMKSKYKSFQKKHFNFMKSLESKDGDNFSEIEYLANIREIITEYEKKSKIKNIESDILEKRTRNLNQPQYLSYTRRFLKFKHNIETTIIDLIERMKDLYYDHISKCCCNFSSLDYHLLKLNETNNNEIIEEEFLEEIIDENLEINNTLSVYKSNNKKSQKPFNVKVIYDYDDLVKQYNDAIKAEFHDINKIIAKQNSFITSFYSFIRMRINYVGLCVEVLKKVEIILKKFFEWVKQDKKYLDNLTECIEHMQREGKEKDTRRLYLQAKLQIVQKKVNKANKEVELLRRRQTECIRYVSFANF